MPTKKKEKKWTIKEDKPFWWLKPNDGKVEIMRNHGADAFAIKRWYIHYNCFPTRSAALAKLKKIKAILKEK